MLDLKYILSCVAVMALTTYLIRMLPLVLFRKQIQSQFLQSFLYYIPYAVLAAMTVPAIFSSTASLPSAIVGFIVALFVAYLGKGLMSVAILSCIAVFVVDVIMKLF